MYMPKPRQPAPALLRPVPAVVAEHVSFAYAGGEDALQDVSLSLVNGDFLAVVGPNGGGKTTLLRLLLGLQQPTAGTIRVFGGDPSLMRRQIGYVPQFSTLRPDFPASVLDVALMGAARPDSRGGSWPTDRRAREKALAWLELLGLADCLGLPVGALSGGLRQRLLVARALMGRPDERGGAFPAGEAGDGFLLLLDEPTANVDQEGKFRFYECLDRLRGRVSLIVVGHDLFTATPFFERIAFVDKGLTPLCGKAFDPGNPGAPFGRRPNHLPAGDMPPVGEDRRSGDRSAPVHSENSGSRR